MIFLEHVVAILQPYSTRDTAQIDAGEQQKIIVP